MYDYIIVGLGFAGISFANLLDENNKKFIVIDDHSQRSTQVSGALYNPVILKRFTPVWKAGEQISLLQKQYQRLEKLLQFPLDISMPIYRKFASIEEQNLWFEVSDKPLLKPYLSAEIKNSNQYPHIQADYGLGEVLHTGRIDTSRLLQLYSEYLDDQERLLNEHFEYDQLQIQDDLIEYKGLRAKRIAFCEGYGLKKNPFFNYLPLVGCKGEVLTIYSKELKLDAVLKGNGFIIPMGDDLYKLGSTYNWGDYTSEVTEKSKKDLLDKLHKLIDCEYEIVSQEAAIRPTVKDRRPLVGQHPKYQNLWVLNGLGTRGSMIAPYAAEQLFQAIESKNSLDKEMDIQRYESLFEGLEASS